MPVIIESRDARETARREMSDLENTLQEIENDVFERRATYTARAAHHAPGREHHTHHHGDLEGALNARSRFVGAHRHLPAREHQAYGPFKLPLLDESVLEDVQIFHEVTESAKQSTEVTMDEVVVEAARRRRRARAPHRAFRLTGTQLMIGGLLLAQLLGVLWLQSQSLALRNRDFKLRREIAQTRELIAQKQNQISQLDSETHLGQLAAQLHWDKAPMNSFDKLNDTRRLTPQETASLAQKPPSGTLIARTN
jgi:hypothetical protein